MKSSVYLDYAAATPLDTEVAKTMRQAEGVFANPSAQYGSARKARHLLEQARKDTAMFLGANTDEIIFTSGATESNNLAILGTARMNKKGRIISVGTEHASVREPLQQLEKEGYEVVWCKVAPYGLVDQKDFAKLLTKNTVLVSIAYANGELGSIQQLGKLTKLTKTFNPRIIVHADASAAALLLNCDVSRLGVDLLTLSANKVYGPAGIGTLYVRRGTKLAPIVYGGLQQQALRPGTEALDLAVGLAKALQIVQTHRKADEQKFAGLTKAFMGILASRGPVTMIGHPKQRLAGTMTICFEGVNGEDIVAYMDAAGFEIATGAACEAAKAKTSPALLAIGLSKSQAQGSVRISFGRTTTTTQVEDAAKALIKTLETLNYKWGKS